MGVVKRKKKVKNIQKESGIQDETKESKNEKGRWMKKMEEWGEQTPSISVPVQLLRRDCSARTHTRTRKQQTASSADG